MLELSASQLVLVIAWEGGQFGINCPSDEKSILNCQSEARAIFIDFSSQGQFIPNLPDSTCYYGLIVNKLAQVDIKRHSLFLIKTLKQKASI